MTGRPKTTAEALADLGRAFDEALGLSRMVAWLDGQIRRFPRFYAWLERRG